MVLQHGNMYHQWKGAHYLHFIYTDVYLCCEWIKIDQDSWNWLEALVLLVLRSNKLENQYSRLKFGLEIYAFPWDPLKNLTENEWPVAASEGKLIDKQSEKLKRMFNIKINVFIVESMFTDAQSPSVNINNVEKILL